MEALKKELLSLAKKSDGIFEKIENKDAISRISYDKIKNALDKYDFKGGVPLEEITEDVIQLLDKWTLQTNHPMHFGLFQPSVTSSGVVADALAAIYNPQLGAWWFSPAANEIEKISLDYITRKLGFDPKTSFSYYTNGGSESNFTAVLCALTRRFPEYRKRGLLALKKQPIIYASVDAHDSIIKIAHQAGLGREAVIRIPVDEKRRLDVGKLELQIKQDRQNDLEPFMVIATAGTTAFGVIDPLSEIASLGKSENLWVHVDGAWGAGFVLSENTRSFLKGIHEVDSITWDPHKTLPVPTGAGFFLTKHKEATKRTFSIDAHYVPDELEDRTDLYKVGLLWSRRFIGLKIFMLLAELGEENLSRMLNHQFEMGNYLRKLLVENGWEIVNHTSLPVICFRHQNHEFPMQMVLDYLLERRKCWISNVEYNGESVLRACISSYKTNKKHVEMLVEELNYALIHLPPHCLISFPQNNFCSA